MPLHPQRKTVALYFLTPLLIKSINSSKEHNIFPDLAKAALVFRLDEEKPNKIDI